jgi:hypothetical protein
MSKWKHRLTHIDKTKLSATCAACGETSIRVCKKNGDVRCVKSGNRFTHAQQRYLKEFCISEEQAIKDDLFSSDSIICEICKGPAIGRDRAYDHSHDTGKIRGVLCRYCNLGLGYFKDNKNSLNTAIEYLTKYE